MADQGTVSRQGVNQFIAVQVGENWQLINCCNKISTKDTAEVQKYMCQSNGLRSGKVMGSEDGSATLSGVSKIYTDTQEATNWSIKKWRAAKKAGTPLRFAIGLAEDGFEDGDEVEVFTAVITDISKEDTVGGIGTWDVSLDIDENGIQYITL